MWFLFVVALYALQVSDISGAKCGCTPIAPNLNGFIVGGVDARPYSLPWQVRLGYKIGGSSWTNCGGSIVANKYVITAAHCIKDLENRQYYVMAGINNYRHYWNDKYYKKISASKVISHPSWDAANVAKGNDIAIIELSESLSFNNGIQPICLPSAGHSYKADTHFIVSGWGTTSEGGRSSDKLKQTIVNHVDLKTCEKQLGRSRSGLPGQLCAAEAGKDSCQGDSGGPLVTKINNKWVLSGVVSWGYGCARANSPGAYTDVAQYRAFIDKHVKI